MPYFPLPPNNNGSLPGLLSPVILLPFESSQPSEDDDHQPPPTAWACSPIIVPHWIRALLRHKDFKGKFDIDDGTVMIGMTQLLRFAHGFSCNTVICSLVHECMCNAKGQYDPSAGLLFTNDARLFFSNLKPLSTFTTTTRNYISIKLTGKATTTVNNDAIHRTTLRPHPFYTQTQQSSQCIPLHTTTNRQHKSPLWKY